MWTDHVQFLFGKEKENEEKGNEKKKKGGKEKKKEAKTIPFCFSNLECLGEK